MGLARALVVVPVAEAVEHDPGVRVTDRFTTVIGQQILLRDIGDLGSLVIFSQ